MTTILASLRAALNSDQEISYGYQVRSRANKPPASLSALSAEPAASSYWVHASQPGATTPRLRIGWVQKRHGRWVWRRDLNATDTRSGFARSRSDAAEDLLYDLLADPVRSDPWLCNDCGGSLFDGHEH